MRTACEQCGAEFEKRRDGQRFCSNACANSNWRKRNRVPRVAITFTCAYRRCGRTVVTQTDRLDKRTRFCCRECERKYWRHPNHDSPVSHIVQHASDIKRDNEQEERETRVWTIFGRRR